MKERKIKVGDWVIGGYTSLTSLKDFQEIAWKVHSIKINIDDEYVVPIFNTNWCTSLSSIRLATQDEIKKAGGILEIDNYTMY